MENVIITISRGFGSNGVAIAKKVAQMLGVNYYDDAALKKMASGRLQSALNELDNLSPDDASAAADDVYLMQADQIHALADRESCVIMGRAADYILRNEESVIRVNLHSGFEDCVRLVVERDGLTYEEAKEKIRETDSARAEFYQRKTGQVWNDPLSFDLTLNSFSIGSDSCAELIVNYVGIWKQHHGM